MQYHRVFLMNKYMMLLVAPLFIMLLKPVPAAADLIGTFSPYTGNQKIFGPIHQPTSCDQAILIFSDTAGQFQDWMMRLRAVNNTEIHPHVVDILVHRMSVWATDMAHDVRNQPKNRCISYAMSGYHEIYRIIRQIELNHSAHSN